jgi:hypothetical protein
MKHKIFAALVALAVCLPALVQAKTLKFPKDNPQFSITFASDWKAEITDAGIISAQPKGAAYAISIFPVQATTAKGAIEETLKEVEKRFTDVKSSEPSEFTTENGVKFLERDYTGKDKDSPRALAILAFSVDKETFYALFQAGTPEADKKYTEDVVAIVKSIKSLKASQDDDE